MREAAEALPVNDRKKVTFPAVFQAQPSEAQPRFRECMDHGSSLHSTYCMYRTRVEKIRFLRSHDLGGRQVHLCGHGNNNDSVWATLDGWRIESSLYELDPANQSLGF